MLNTNYPLGQMELIILIACWILFDLNLVCYGTMVPAQRIQYTRDQLLAWNSPSLLSGQYPLSKLPGGILRRVNCNSAPGDDAGIVKKRKRGKRGGVRQRLRSKQLTRIALPSLIVGNVQSLRNKLDELQGNVRFLQDYRNSCAMAFTESWLTEQDLDNGLSVDGFGIPFRTDRNAEITGKSRGGGVCLYVNKRYCTSVTVRENICTPDMELLSVSLRPFYLPREFPQIFITVVYIHPKANNIIASNTVSDVVQGLQNISPEAPNFILGDFNHVSLKKSLPNFYQYITCPTRHYKTLDLCYGNIKGAYKSVPLSALGSADHNCVQLLPIYRPLFKREKPHTREVKMWTDDSTARLQGCFDCTDWEVFKDSCEHIDELTDVVCSYITFCEDMIVPTRKFKVFSNTKPWMTKSVKSSLRNKQLAYRQGDRLERVTARKEVRTEIFKAKQAYKVKLEKNLADNNLGSAWSGMKKIAGIQHNVNKSTVCIDGFRSNDYFSNALNMFYSRFESFDFKNEVEELRCLCNDDSHMVLEQAAVEKIFLST